MNDIGKLLMFSGAGIFITGLVLYLGARFPLFGQMPGNIVIQRDNFTLFAPVGAMIVVSILLTIIVNVIARFFR